MATKTTDPGLGAPDSAKTHDTALTDPMSGVDATTDPTTPSEGRGASNTAAGAGSATVPDARAATVPEARAATVPDARAAAAPEARAATVPDASDDLLVGLRRERPPPRLSPRIRAESEGSEAAAYYAGPQSLPARFDTPPPEEAVEIATTPTGATTDPLPGAPARLPPVAIANAPAPAPAAREIAAGRKPVQEETVPRRRKRKSPSVAMFAGALLFGAVVATWLVLRLGREPTQEEIAPPVASSPAVPSASASANATPSSRAIVPSAAPSAVLSAAPAPAPSPTDPQSPPAGRIDATASAVLPTVRPPAGSGVAGAGSTAPRDPARAPTPPATIPSTEPPHPPASPAPPSSPSAKIDHVRTI